MAEVSIGTRDITCGKCGSKLSVHRTGAEPKPDFAVLAGATSYRGMVSYQQMVRRGRVARISGKGALTPTPFGVMRCGRTPGVPAPACGSAHGRQPPPRSPDAGPCGSAARHRSPV